MKVRMAREFQTTTDDEAFIRGILASPGEDLPRLVYADWLEDRGDERGTYLRHEVLWAKTKDAKAEKRLRAMTKDLDAMWVMRVSRPPIGVCCLQSNDENSTFESRQIEVSNAERRLGINLPLEYQAFRLNFGTKDIIFSDSAPGHRRADWRFCPLSECERLIETLAIDPLFETDDYLHWLSSFIYLGSCPNRLCLFLGIADDYADRIHEMDPSSDEIRKSYHLTELLERFDYPKTAR